MCGFERTVVACISVIVALLALRFNIEGDDVPDKHEAQLTDRQPDYAKWKSVEKGDGENEVRDVLGEAIENKNVNGVIFSVFGRISYPTELFPKPFEFVVLFRDGKVMDKSDPFSGRLSTDGVPTTPVPVDSDDIRVFDHYPRFVDLRWCPASGEYPMEYVVESEFGQPGKTGNVWMFPVQKQCKMPHCVLVHGGRNPGRWRVKAKNRLGESGWSDWRGFRFNR